MPKSRRLRMGDVEPGLEQHDGQEDKYAEYFAEMDQMKVEAHKFRKELREARLERVGRTPIPARATTPRR